MVRCEMVQQPDGPLLRWPSSHLVRIRCRLAPACAIVEMANWHHVVFAGHYRDAEWSQGSAVPLDLSERWFAWVMGRTARHYDGLLADRKRSLLSEVGGTVVEIGPGTGTNFRYYPRNIHWIGVEPNRYMHPYLQRAAEAAGVPIEVLLGRAENLSLPDESADAVVATAVLCSVDDPHKALQEVRRVLKPGGRFVFVEHVAAKRGKPLRGIQRTVQPLWSCIAGGCHPDRDTGELISQAGLRPLVLDEFKLPLGPVAPHISGVAVRE